MRSSTWLAIIGVSVLTFIILVFTGSIKFQVEDAATDDSASGAKTVSIVREYEPTTAEKTIDLNGLNG